MRMRLKHHSTRTHHLPPLPPVIAWRAHLLKSAMGYRQGVRLWQSSLAGGLSGPVYIDHHPLPACSVKQAAGGRKGLAGQQILLKKRPKRLHTGLIESGQKTREGRAMRQTVSAKKRHKGVRPQIKPFE